MQSCVMQQENEVPTQNIMEILLCIWAYKIKCTCFENIFCPSLPAESQKKLNLPKLQPLYVDVTIIVCLVLMQQICILELTNQVLKLVCFRDLE